MPNEKRKRLFASSPLITPQRLKSDLAHVFELAPPWARNIALAGPEDYNENVAIAYLGRAAPGIWYFDPTALAILFEVTRYGHSVATNSNVKADANRGHVYPKITFSGAAEDAMPLSRIIMDAAPKEVVRSAETIGDLRASFLRTVGGPKANTHAREVALGHAESAARKHGLGEDEITAYLENIRSLFALHDAVHMPRPSSTKKVEG